MSSLPSVLLTVLLFSDVCRHPAAALPLSGAGNYDDDRTDQESLNALFEDNIGSKLPAGGGGGGLGGDLTAAGISNRLDERTPRIIVVSDSGFRGHRTHSPDRAFSRALPDPNAAHAPGDLRVKVDRRETDLDMLRCMIGRVYRPCWQA